MATSGLLWLVRCVAIKFKPSQHAHRVQGRFTCRDGGTSKLVAVVRSFCTAAHSTQAPPQSESDWALHAFHALSGGTRKLVAVVRSSLSYLRHCRAVGATTDRMNRRLPTAVAVTSLCWLWVRQRGLVEFLLQAKLLMHRRADFMQGAKCGKLCCM